MKKLMSVIFIFVFVVSMLPQSIYAAQTSSSGITPAEFRQKLEEANDGDVLVLSTGYFTGDYVIDKAITIVGSGSSYGGSYTSFSGTFKIQVPDDKEVKFKNVRFAGGRVQKPAWILEISSKVNLVLEDVYLMYISAINDGSVVDFRTIYVDENSNGAKIKMTNSFFFSCFYNLIVKASDTVVDIENSTISGDVAIEYENGSNNVLNMKNTNVSTGSSFVRSPEEAISIRGQDNLKIKIQGGKIYGANVTKPNHLFSFDDENSSNVSIELGPYEDESTSTKTYTAIVDENSLPDTKVFNFGNSKKENNNSIYLESGVTVEPDDIVEKYSISDDYVVIGVHDKEGNCTIKQYEKDAALQLESAEVEGYRFSGWYKDKEFNEAFDISQPVTENMEIYPKYEKIIHVTIDEHVFELLEGQSLSDLNEEDLKILEAYETAEDEFLYFENVDTKEKVEKDTVLNEDITITAVYDLSITITIGEEEFTLNEGQTLNDLSPEDKERLEALKVLDGQMFSHFVDEEDKIIDMNTPLEKDCKLTAVFTDFPLGDYDESTVVDITDAYLILLDAVNETEITERKLKVGDLNNDKRVDVSDAYMVLNMLAKRSID